MLLLERESGSIKKDVSTVQSLAEPSWKLKENHMLEKSSAYTDNYVDNIDRKTKVDKRGDG